MKKRLRFVVSLMMALSILIGCFGGLTIPASASDNIGTVTFVYTGTDEAKTAANLWFYVNWAKSASLKPEGGAGQLGDFQIGWSQSTYAGKPCVILSGDTADLSEVWITLGFSVQIGESLGVEFDGSVYSVSDTTVTLGYSKPAHTHTPTDVWSSNETHHYHDCTDTECTETDVSKLPDYATHVYDSDQDTDCNTCGYTREVSNPKSYSFTIHVYTNGLTGTWLKSYMGEWQEEAYPTLGGESDGWSTAVYTLNTTEEYNKYTFYYYIAASDYMEYVYHFAGTANELWIIPGDGTVYTGKPSTGGDITPEHTHTWSDWQTNETDHWKVCEGEGCTSPVATSEKALHSYDDEQDTQCNICGYTREVSAPKSYSFTIHAYTKGLTGYWLRTCLGDWKEDAYPAFGTESAGWSDATYVVGSENAYEQLIICFYKDASDYTTWIAPIDSITGEYWVIPDNTTVFTSREMAEATLHTHQWSNVWFNDENGHWHGCTEDCPITDNHLKSDYSVHDYGDDTICDTCGYSSHLHNWNSDWVYDDSNHWHKCNTNGCVEKNETASHTYTDDKTTKCNICDYQRGLGKYEFTIHAYTKGITNPVLKAQLGNHDEEQTLTFRSETGDWQTATYTVSTITEYTRLWLYLYNDNNEPTACSYTFTNKTGEVWIIAGNTSVYSDEQKALEALPRKNYNFKVHIYGPGWLTAWMAREIGGAETAWTSQDQNQYPVLAVEGDGWASAEFGWNQLNDGFNRLAFTINGEEPTYNCDFVGYNSEFWIIPGETTPYMSKEAALATLPSVNPVNKIFTVHVYGPGWLTAWMARVVDGTEMDWTASDEAMQPALVSEGNGWSVAKLSWSNQTKEFNRLSFQYSGDSSITYHYDFSGSGGEIWIIPGVDSTYGSKSVAETELKSGANESTLIVHLKKPGSIDGWKVSAYYTAERDGSWGGKTVGFAYKDEWGYVAVIRYPERLEGLSIQLHQKCLIDGNWFNDWWAQDSASKSIVPLYNGQREIWIEFGKSGFQTTPPAGCTWFDQGVATPYNQVPYITHTSPPAPPAPGLNAQLTIHYFRHDGDYQGWAIGAWGKQKNGVWTKGSAPLYGKDEYGAATGVLSLLWMPVDEVEFVAHYNNWQSQDGEPVKVDVRNMITGDNLHVYIYSGYDGIFLEPQEELMLPPQQRVVLASNAVQTLNTVKQIIPAELMAQKAQNCSQIPEIPAQNRNLLWILILAGAVGVGGTSAAMLMLLLREKGRYSTV